MRCIVIWSFQAKLNFDSLDFGLADDLTYYSKLNYIS